MDPTRQLTAALEDAVRAPSVHNTQPWRWRVDDASVHLHADWARHLVTTDPDRRDLVLSCGAALHHLLVALAARGIEAQVDRTPSPDRADHLATVTARTGAGLPADPSLQPAIDRRRTDRRRLSHRPVPPEHVQLLEERVRGCDARLTIVHDPALRQHLTAALVDAAARQHRTPGYLTELEKWTSRYAGAHDGIPRENVPPPLVGAVDAPPLRQFPEGRLHQPRRERGHQAGADASELVIIATTGDDTADRLRAGEALSALLLSATTLGLAATTLSQAVEVHATRRAVRREVLRSAEQPHVVVRVGWPATNAVEIPPTPRRPVRSVLMTA